MGTEHTYISTFRRYDGFPNLKPYFQKSRESQHRTSLAFPSRDYEESYVVLIRMTVL